LLLAVPAAAEQLPLRAYDIQSGLAGDSVTDILRDSRGYLWLATMDGVSRFDGERFTSYSGEDGLPHGRVYQVLETRDGTYWVATHGGLARFLPSRPAGRPAFAPVAWGGADREAVHALYEDRTGRLWVGGEGRVSVLVRGPHGYGVRPVPLGGLAVGQIGGFAETADGSFWIGCEGGLLRRLPDGRTVVYPVRPHHGTDAVLDLAVDAAGRLWIVQALGAFVFLPEDAAAVGSGPVASLHERAEQAGAVIAPGGPACEPQRPGEVCALTAAADAFWYGVHPARDGRVWLATSRGLVEWAEDAGMTVWGEENGLPEPSVTAVNEDREGNLWLGTGSRGALRLARRGLMGYTARDGLADVRISALLTGADGALYGQSGGMFDAAFFLHRLQGTRFTSLHPRLPAGVTEPQAVLAGRTGEWWIATGQGLLRYPAVPFAALAGTAPTLFTSRDGLGGDRVTHLFEDRRGDLWIGGFGARPLSRWQRATGAFRAYGVAEGWTGTPSAFAEDRRGNLWIGLSEGGLARVRTTPDGLRFEALGAAQGVPPGPVRALYVDRAGRLWVGTEDGGAGRLDATAAPLAELRLVTYTPQQGLSSSEIRCITEDAWGRIYLGGRKGIDRLDPASGRIQRFTTADGLLDNVVDAAGRDAGDALWFGTRRGLSRLQPALAPLAQPPAAWITSVRVDGVPRIVSELGVPAISGPDLEAESRLEVEYLAQSFAPGGALRYQHKMEGVDSDWSEPAVARVVQYAELPEGWQRFEVRAVTRDGAVGKPAVIVFHVEPPVWRRAWVWMLTAAGLTVLAAGFFRYRLGHLLAIERMRTRIATDLHDDLGSSLSRVSILSEVAKRRVAADSESASLLTEIGDAAREMMEALGESIWAIDPRRDDLRSFVTRVRRFAGDLLDNRGVAWQLRAPSESELVKLSPVQRRQLFLLVKEALHNVARHSEAAAVSITLTVSGRKLTLEIRDDGRGFDPAAVPADGGHHGLRNLRQRAAALGARLEIDTAPGRGTRLFLEAQVPTVGRAVRHA
jgi:ligand-binding sensor domain-containing protein/signal transduction histidine kinase